MVFEGRIFFKNNDGRQTGSDVKPGRVGLLLGWVTTFRQKPLYRPYYSSLKMQTVSFFVVFLVLPILQFGR